MDRTYSKFELTIEKKVFFPKGCALISGVQNMVFISI